MQHNISYSSTPTPFQQCCLHTRCMCRNKHILWHLKGILRALGQLVKGSAALRHGSGL